MSETQAQDWEPGLVRSGVIYVAPRVKDALTLLSGAQGRPRDAIASEALVQWLEKEHPDVLEFVKKRNREEREFEEKLKAESRKKEDKIYENANAGISARVARGGA